MPTFQLDDCALYFDDSGAGTAVLLLHGLGSLGQDWSLVAPDLVRHHRVVIPDVRGHGRSGKPAGDYGVPLFARDVAALCAHLGLASVHVIGLSMGGMIGFQLAVSYPALVRSLVIVNSGPELVPRTLRMKLALGLRLTILKVLGPRVLGKVLAPKLFPKPEQAELRQRLQQTFAANDPSAYLRATKGLIGWSVAAHLPTIKCPVLVLASDRDYTPLSAKQEYVKRLPRARLQEISDSGHAAPMDQPAKIVAAVLPFLQEVEAYRADLLRR